MTETRKNEICADLWEALDDLDRDIRVAEKDRNFEVLRILYKRRFTLIEAMEVVSKL